MNTELEKPVCLPELYAMGLARLAEEQCATQNALLEKALGRLFQQEMNANTYAEWEVLKEAEAEFGPAPPRRVGRTINSEDIVSIVSAPINPKSIRWEGKR